jgi:hypothetical protein
MKRILSVLAVVTALSLLLPFALPAAAATNLEGYAAEVARLVNIERANAGKPALNYGNKALNDGTRQRAREIAVLFEHDRPDGRTCWTIWDDFPIEGSPTGENIAAGQPTPAAVVQAWMNSPGHRANILTDTSNWIGVGVYETGGALYWVQLFATGDLTDDGDAAAPDSGATATGNTGNTGGNTGGAAASIFTQIWNWIVWLFSWLFSFRIFIF